MWLMAVCAGKDKIRVCSVISIVIGSFRLTVETYSSVRISMCSPGYLVPECRSIGLKNPLRSILGILLLRRKVGVLNINIEAK
jgi:hypothetical protein